MFEKQTVVANVFGLLNESKAGNKYQILETAWGTEVFPNHVFERAKENKLS